MWGRSLGSMPGPWSRTVTVPSWTALRSVLLRAPLHGVVEQVRDRASEGGRDLDDRLAGARSGTAFGTAAGRRLPPRRGGRDGPVAFRVCARRRGRARGAPRSDWSSRGARRSASASRRRRSSAGDCVQFDQFEVGAGRGEWRPQLVRGVGDQLTLGADGSRQGVEHRVEGVCESAELVRTRSSVRSRRGRLLRRSARRSR